MSDFILSLQSQFSGSDYIGVCPNSMDIPNRGQPMRNGVHHPASMLKVGTTPQRGLPIKVYYLEFGALL